MKQTVLIILLGSILFVGCKEEKNIDELVNLVSETKIELEKVYNRSFYKAAEHKIIATYFRSSVKLAEKIKSAMDNSKNQPQPDWGEDEWYMEPNSEFEARPFDFLDIKDDLPGVCEKIVVDYSIWKQIVNTCQKNEFFICNEEVKSFPLVMSRLFALGKKINPDIEYGKTCAEWNEKAK